MVTLFLGQIYVQNKQPGRGSTKSRHKSVSFIMPSQNIASTGGHISKQQGTRLLFSLLTQQPPVSIRPSVPSKSSSLTSYGFANCFQTTSSKERSKSESPTRILALKAASEIPQFRLSCDTGEGGYVSWREGLNHFSFHSNFSDTNHFPLYGYLYLPLFHPTWQFQEQGKQLLWENIPKEKGVI